MTSLLPDIDTPPLRWTPTQIRHARAQLGWTQLQFAAAIGVSYDVVRNWCSGKHKIHICAQRLLEIWLAHPEVRPEMGERKRTLRNVA